MTTKYDSLENSIFSNQFLALIFYLFFVKNLHKRRSVASVLYKKKSENALFIHARYS
jgi:hypothetical protein